MRIQPENTITAATQTTIAKVSRRRSPLLACLAMLQVRTRFTDENLETLKYNEPAFRQLANRRPIRRENLSQQLLPFRNSSILDALKTAPGSENLACSVQAVTLTLLQ